MRRSLVMSVVAAGLTMLPARAATPVPFAAVATLTLPHACAIGESAGGCDERTDGFTIATGAETRQPCLLGAAICQMTNLSSTGPGRTPVIVSDESGCDSFTVTLDQDWFVQSDFLFGRVGINDSGLAGANGVVEAFTLTATNGRSTPAGSSWDIAFGVMDAFGTGTIRFEGTLSSDYRCAIGPITTFRATLVGQLDA